MTITEAMCAVNDEYSEECLRAQGDPAYNAVMTDCMAREYAEIDRELVHYVVNILLAQGVPEGTVIDPVCYQMARMTFRLGMRVQRKLDAPGEPTSFFWRSDQRAV